MKQKADEGIKAKGTAKRKATANTKAAKKKRKRSGFMFYASWIDDIRKLPIDEQKELIFALVMYGTKRTRPKDLSMNTEIYFNFCHRIINYDLDRYGLGSLETANRTYRSGGEALFSSLPEEDGEPFGKDNGEEPQNTAQLPDNDKRTEMADRQVKDEADEEPQNTAQLPDNDKRTEMADRQVRDEADEEPQNTAQLPDNDKRTPDTDKTRKEVVPKEAQLPDNDKRTSPHILPITDYELPIKHLEEEKEEEKSSSKEAEVFASPGATAGAGHAANATGHRAESQETGETEAARTTTTPDSEAGEEEEPEKPCTLEEAKAYWRQMGYKSVVEEFYRHYEARKWRTRHGGRMRYWKNAARCWEQYFVKTVYPLRRREAEARETAERAERQVRENRAEWERQRREREAEYERQEQRAVSPQEARKLYEDALRKTGGDTAAAIELLKQYRPAGSPTAVATPTTREPADRTATASHPCFQPQFRQP